MRRFCPIFLVLLLTAVSVRASDEPIPDAMRDVGIEERLGAQLPLDTVFTNELGRQVTLRDCLLSGKPAVLQLGYFGCPMLCDLVSKGMLSSMEHLDLNIGGDFSVIYLSFDPRETKNDAYLKKKTYLEHYSRSGAGGAWHFLTGSPNSVRSVADAVGFKYKWVEANKQFSHAAALIVLTPDGKVSRYLYGVEFPQRTLRLSLVEASSGAIASTIDKVLMLCFQYDPSLGKYTFQAIALMRLGGVLTVLLLGGVLCRMFLKERRAVQGL